ncbi:hypothetical protein SAMN05216362_12822 [Piscibacillus halophilus]|uniref:Uncharacterized protein n=2 Tax=Piscibacillus halophilus TaxID=571933 RepID=A0A1H9J2N7_9BACI|nr:hypothetical protein SAMN05216362_12822 [Piscibacillus halophilus]
MMFDKIFQDIVDIIHHDYAGCRDKKGWDQPEKFLDRVRERELSIHEFTNLVEEYLADLKDPHMFFRIISDEKPQDIGFKVRRYEDALYITEVTKEERLQVGARIVALNLERDVDLERALEMLSDNRRGVPEYIG